MKKKSVIILSVVLVVSTAAVTWLAAGGWSSFMPPIQATLPQDSNGYSEEERQVLDASRRFWTAMENADEAGMRSVADPNCTFVHIGMTCKLDEEIQAYTSGMFQPTEIAFHGQSVERYGDTAVVLTDCDYSLRLGGHEHHAPLCCDGGLCGAGQPVESDTVFLYRLDQLNGGDFYAKPEYQTWESFFL